MCAFRLDEDAIIGDILDAYPGCEAVFSSLGLGCMGCPSAHGETVREACGIHGIAAADLLERLRRRAGEK